MLQNTGQKIMYDMRMEVFRHLQKLSPSFYDKNPVGRLITRVITDVDVLNEMFSAGIVSIFGDIFSLLGITVAILLLNWQLGLVTLSVVPLIGLATAIFRRKARDSYRRVRIAIAKINAYLQEHITGMSVVQLYNRERKSFKKFDRINREHLQAHLDGVLAYSWFYPVIELLSSIATRPDHLVRRRPESFRESDRLARWWHLFNIRARFFQPIARHEREVQHPSIGDGQFGAPVQACRHARRGAQSGQPRAAFPGSGG